MTLEIRKLFNYEICNNIIQKQFSLMINVKNSHFKNWSKKHVYSNE